MEIHYKPSFLRDFKKLSRQAQLDAKEKIALFRDTKNHEQLQVHKLRDRLKECYSFSVTYSHRIVFTYKDKSTIIFLPIGDHDVYK
jgi:mRNA-degrading endonuclease YafQ of YafQ-DinJ toxin-antitoxin module